MGKQGVQIYVTSVLGLDSAPSKHSNVLRYWGGGKLHGSKINKHTMQQCVL
jgi:hypothetical protein